MRGRTWCATAVVAAGAVAFAAAGAAAPRDDHAPFGAVPTANTKAAGYAPWNRLANGLQEVIWAQGATGGAPLATPGIFLTGTEM